MTAFGFVSFRQSLPYWPSDILGEPEFLDEIGFRDFHVTEGENLFSVNGTLLWFREISFSLPGLGGVSLAFLSADGYAAAPFEVDIQPQLALRLPNISVSLRIATDLLRPMRHDGAKWIPVSKVAGSPSPAEIRLDGIGVEADQDGGFQILMPAGAPQLSLGAVSIGETGIVLEVDGVTPYFSATQPLPVGAPPGFRGVTIDAVKLHLPPDMAVPLDPTDLTFEKMLIGTGGFSGTIRGEWPVSTFDKTQKQFTGNGSGKLFGIPFALRSLSLSFTQNVPNKSSIAGELLVPFFEQPIGVEIAIGLDGSLSVALAAVQPKDVTQKSGIIEFEKAGLLKLSVESLGFSLEGGRHTIKLSGSLTPLALGLDAPSFDVRELAIDSEGNVHLDGGWLDLPSQYTLDFHGFQLEITKFGLGKTGDGGKWLGFAGSVKLVEGLPAGASVDGLRITWYDDGSKPLAVTMSGVGVEFEIPDVLRFKGGVSFDEPTKTFEGDIKLELLVLDMTLDAKLVVGQASDAGKSYGFFAIYLEAELPAGIPLAATGLAFYGFSGLFASQMAPNRRPEEGWYENLDGNAGWYKKEPVGIVDLKSKWDPERGSLALGAGVTIGTLPDNGHSFHGKLLFVLVLPGPIILLEGRGDLLKKRTKHEGGGVEDEPVFRALAVLDGRAGSVTIGLDARYKFGGKGEVVDIRGSAEAFFSFHDASAWHIYIGRKEPRERRILAKLFKVFQANAYFMLDGKNPFLQTGAWIGYELNLKLGPAALELSAFIEGGAVVSRKPVHFFGELTIHGSLKVSLFGIGFGLTAHAHAAADVYDPFKIHFDFLVAIDLPWPLPDFKVEFSIEWGPELVAPPLPIPLKEVAVEHLKATTTWPLPRDGAIKLLMPDYNRGDDFLAASLAGASEPANLYTVPVVPLDAKPHITFARPVNDDAGIGVNPQPTTPEWETIGDPNKQEGPVRARFSLKSVALEKRSGTAWKPVAWSPNNTPATPREKLYGSWAPVPSLTADPGNADQVKLWLWSKSPFDYTRHAGRSWDEWVSSALPNYPCVPTAPDREECFDLSGVDPNQVGADEWHPPGHPEITVRFVDDGDAIRVTIELPADATGVEVRPEDHSDVVLVRRCVDFVSDPVATGPNPRVDFDVQFEVHSTPGAAATLAPSSSIVTAPGSGAGLLCAQELQVTLPRPASVVDVVVSQAPAGSNIAALRADGALVKQHALPSGSRQRVTMSGEGITGLLLHTNGEAVLHELCFTYASMSVSATDGDGRVVTPSWGPGTATIPGASGAAIISGVDGLGAVTVTLDHGTRLGRVCVIRAPDPDDVRRREEMSKHLIDETARWSQTADLFEPDTIYRLKLVTQVEARSDLALKGYSGAAKPYQLLVGSTNAPPKQEQYAFFRTSGPPGLTSLSRPTSLPEEVPFATGLDDLTPYVRQTIPPTVPRVGELPFRPRPVYRAYDVGVEFNEDYVDQMYRMARRDLAMHLFDANSHPVRDAQGRLVTPINLWGRTETLTLSESQERWIKTVNAGACATIDETKIPSGGTIATRLSGEKLAADAVYEARLVPLLWHEDFASIGVGSSASGTKAVLGGWVIAEQATTATGSRWEVQHDGTPAAAYVTQTANFVAGTDDGRDPVKPGSCLLLSDRDGLAISNAAQPSQWTDFRLALYVRATRLDGATGAVFRYSDADNYYRFSMDGKRRYRRLVKVIAGKHTVLAEDDFALQPNVDAQVVVECIGTSLRLYQDGEIVFTVNDASLAVGRIGLYCWGNAAPRFADVRVEDFSKDAKPVYRFAFTTSKFANFFHQSHSYADETWRKSVDLSTAFAKVGSPNDPPTDTEHRGYESGADSVLGSRANRNPERVEVTRLEHDGAWSGLLLESPEPLDWARTSFQLMRANRRVGAPAAPTAVKLTGATFASSAPNQESVSLLLLEDVDLSGYRIERGTLPGPDTEVASPPMLLLASFVDSEDGVAFVESLGPNALDGYDVVDLEPPVNPSKPYVSSWVVKNDRIEQGNDYRGGLATADLLPRRPGTLAVLKKTFANTRTTFTLQTGSLRDVGVLFRFQDSEHYYRFSMARLDAGTNGSFRRLVKRINGAVTVLWEDAVTVDSSEATRIVVETFADRLVGYVNDSLVFNVRDADLVDGRPGYYCWGNTQAFFEGLQVELLRDDPVLWEPAFADAQGLQIFDEPATGPTPSSWTAVGGVLLQSSLIAGPDGSWEAVVGSATDIAVGADGSVWSTGTTAAGPSMQAWNGRSWDEKGPGGVRVAVDSAGVPWIVDAAGAIQRWNGGGFDRLLDRANDVAIGGAGSPPYVIGSLPIAGGFGVFYWQDPGWVQIPGGALRIAVDPSGQPWVVNDAGQILSFDFATVAWHLLPGVATDIAVGGEGSVWVVGTQAAPGGHLTYRWDGLKWEPFAGQGAVAIAVGPDGNPWVVTDAGAIARWVGHVARKPGTYVLGGPSGLTDLQVNVRLRSDSNGALGVLFRYRDDANYYRFSMDRDGNYRRLVKKVDGAITLLWEDWFQYTLGKSYDLRLRAEGSCLTGYLDGVRIFRVRDFSHREGRVGFYSHANPSARFDRVLVTSAQRAVGPWTVRDEADQGSPSRWRVRDGSLRQLSVIGDADPAMTDGSLVCAGNAIWGGYRATADVVSVAQGAVGLLFRYRDDGNYYRFALDAQRGVRVLSKVVDGVSSELWQAAGSDPEGERVRLAVAVAGSELTGYVDGKRLFKVVDSTHRSGGVGVHCRRTANAQIERVEVQALPLQAAALFHDSFAEADLSGWTFDRVGAEDDASAWVVRSGALIRVGSNSGRGRGSGASVARSVALVGQASWDDVLVVAQLTVPAEGVVGVVARYRNSKNHYQFAIDARSKNLALVEVFEGNSSTLWQTKAGIPADRKLALGLLAEGGSIRGYIDGVLAFLIDSARLDMGRAGLMSATNANATFLDLVIYPADRAFRGWILREAFMQPTAERWTFVDEATQGSPSQWSAGQGRLSQSSVIGDAKADAVDISGRGTVAATGDASWADHRISVRLGSDSSGTIGAIFRRQDANNFYRVELDVSGGARRLVKCVQGVFMKLWGDTTPVVAGRDYCLTVDAVGDELAIYIDGVACYRGRDRDVAAGQVGLYCYANGGARFGEVTVAPLVFINHFAFGSEMPLSSGTRIRVYSGREDPAIAAETGVLQRFVTSLDEPAVAQFPTDTLRLRVVSPSGAVGHTRAFLRDAEYGNPIELSLLRKRDGTGVFLIPKSTVAFDEGEYRLTLTYLRAGGGLSKLSEAGDTAAEVAALDIPSVPRV
jgi:hypothetical protein